jgi:hypothetical protein
VPGLDLHFLKVLIGDENIIALGDLKPFNDALCIHRADSGCDLLITDALVGFRVNLVEGQARAGSYR